MVFPARAGMILGFGGLYMEPLGIPRESGDDPFVKDDVVVTAGYSPRERG